MFDFDVLDGVVMLFCVGEELDEGFADVLGDEDGVVLMVLMEVCGGERCGGKRWLGFDVDVIASGDGLGELGGGADEGELFLIEDGNAVTETFDFGHIVTGEDKGFALFFEGANDVMKNGAGFDIEAGGGLV